MIELQKGSKNEPKVELKICLFWFKSLLARKKELGLAWIGMGWAGGAAKRRERR